jgi:hypothetical protein
MPGSSVEGHIRQLGPSEYLLEGGRHYPGVHRLAGLVRKDEAVIFPQRA